MLHDVLRQVGQVRKIHVLLTYEVLTLSHACRQHARGRGDGEEHQPEKSGGRVGRRRRCGRRSAAKSCAREPRLQSQQPGTARCAAGEGTRGRPRGRREEGPGRWRCRRMRVATISSKRRRSSLVLWFECARSPSACVPKRCLRSRSPGTRRLRPKKAAAIRPAIRGIRRANTNRGALPALEPGINSEFRERASSTRSCVPCQAQVFGSRHSCSAAGSIEASAGFTLNPVSPLCPMAALSSPSPTDLGRASVLERFQGRYEFLVCLPTAHGVGIDLLPYLPRAGSHDRPFGLVKR